MKKIISVMITMLMILTSISAFASTTRPEAITLDVNTKTSITNTKVNTKGVTVTPAATNTAEYNTSGGTWEKMFDGNGMIDGYIGGTPGSGYIYENMGHAAALTDAAKNTGRWYLTDNNAKPVLEITLSEPATFNTIKWTEVRDLIKGCTFTFYNGEEQVHTKNDTFTVGNVTSANMTLRTVYLDKEVTANKIVFEVTEVKGGSKPSIAEMEFWNLDADVTVSAGSGISTNNKDCGTVMSLFDGVSVYNSKDNSTRWAVDNNVTSYNTKSYAITIQLMEKATFNTIKWSELRKNIKSYSVVCYDGDTEILNKSDSFTDSDSNTTVFQREVDLGKEITADKIVFTITGHFAKKATSITEMEILNIVVDEPSAVDALGTTIAPLSGYTVAYAFDGKYEGDGSTGINRFVFVPFEETTNETTGETTYPNKYTLPITISFDIGEAKTFNYAQLSELRCALGNIDVLVSTDGIEYDKVGTMPSLDYKGSPSYETIHSVSFDSVTARYVKFVINEMATYEELSRHGNTQKGITINEIALFNYPDLESDEAVIYPVIARGKEVTTLPELFNVSTNITLSNKGNTPKEYGLYSALYDEFNELLDVTYSAVTVEAGKMRTFSIPVSAEGKTVKFFAWDTELSPLYEAVSVSK